MSEALTVITKLSAFTFIITSMLAVGLSLPMTDQQKLMWRTHAQKDGERG